MLKEEALFNFWSSFGLPAYEENAIFSEKDSPEFPYITYEVQTSDFGNEVSLTASLWYRSTSWLPAIHKKDEISSFIGMGGVTTPIDGGCVWIKRGSPFAQQLGDSSDDMIKRIVLNIAVEFFCEN